MSQLIKKHAQVTAVVIPPDGGWGWLVVFIAFLWNLIVDGTVYTFGLFMDDMQRDFEVTPALLSFASSLQSGLCFLLGPLVAAMINRLGFRTVSIIGGLLSFAGVLGSAFSPNIYMFIGTFGGVLGIAFSMTYLSNVLIVGFYFTKYRAVATSIATTGTAFGVCLFPIIFSVLLSDIEWREKYKYISGAHLLITTLGFAIYKPIQASEVIIESSIRPTRQNISETSSMWNELERYDRTHRKITDYPTNAEALYNQDYTVVTPKDINESDSRETVRSNRTQRSTKLASLSIIPVSVLEDYPKYANRCCCCRCTCKYLLCKCMWHTHRPLYRDDILFHGGTSKLPQFNKNLKDKMKAATSYNMTVTRTSISLDLPQNADFCNCCPESVTRVLGSMLDLSLLKSTRFLLLCLSGFLTYLGIYVPYIYGIEILIGCNLERTKATYFLTAIGVSNAFGRIIFGVLTLAPHMNALLISQVTLIFAGAAIVVHPFLKQFEAHLTIACVFGLNIATVSSLRTIVVVDLLGLEKLTNAFGLIVMMEGISCLMALPINSYLYERNNSFVDPCIFSGVAIIISGFILIPIGLLNRRLRKAILRMERNIKINTFGDKQSAATSHSKPKPLMK